MKLDSYYSLRKNFVVIGLTGRVGAGSSTIASKLEEKDFVNQCGYKKPVIMLEPEQIKFDICYNYLLHKNNFEKFETIIYKNILLLHLVFESSKERNSIDYITKVLTQYGDGYDCYENRFGIKTDELCINEVKIILAKTLNKIISKIGQNSSTSLNAWLKNEAPSDFSNYYFNDFREFAKQFYDLLNKFHVTKRTRFLHDIAINLREIGKCFHLPKEKPSENLEHIYTVAETINRIIKIWRRKNGTARIVIDSLKNSLELMYFKEKYSAFFMIAVNRDEDERKKHTWNVIDKVTTSDKESHLKKILYLDDQEYIGSDFHKGDFAGPDIENCIQKSDYHIFYSTENDLNVKEQQTKNLDYQLIKLLALIFQPGIITPTPIERTMQVAFNAKYNSGCISRQVGAVITDENYSQKSIGWNDVAQNQMPCKLRSVEDLLNNKSLEVFSDYEKFGGAFKTNGGSSTFKELVERDVNLANLSELNGRHCSFCFKSFQNTYEGEKNQVHTRSLHAEENAMMQIAKNGGIGLKGGFLFTTASPCELCSKKAFQLGIKKIFYIDPYPGISMSHTLKNGISEHSNPEMEMFRGAIGRAFHKLYEPFMAHKDEILILTGLKPT
jgi:deoxycytidylate deaminase